MGLTLDEMRYLVRKGAGNVDEDELVDVDVDLYLNMSLWELENRFDFRTQSKRYRFDLEVGTYIYELASLTSPNSITSIAILEEDSDADDEGVMFKLTRTGRNWLDENANYSDSVTGMPRRYHREGDCLYLDIKPDKAYTMEITLRQGVASIVEGTKETTGLPRNWDELVVQGAIWRAHFYNEDYERGQQASNFQVGGIRNAVEEKVHDDRDNRYAGLQVLWDRNDE